MMPQQNFAQWLPICCLDHPMDKELLTFWCASTLSCIRYRLDSRYREDISYGLCSRQGQGCAQVPVAEQHPPDLLRVEVLTSIVCMHGVWLVESLPVKCNHQTPHQTVTRGRPVVRGEVWGPIYVNDVTFGAAWWWRTCISTLQEDEILVRGRSLQSSQVPHQLSRIASYTDHVPSDSEQSAADDESGVKNKTRGI